MNEGENIENNLEEPLHNNGGVHENSGDGEDKGNPKTQDVENKLTLNYDNIQNLNEISINSLEPINYQNSFVILSYEFKNQIKKAAEEIKDQNDTLSKKYKDYIDSQRDLYKTINIYTNCECCNCCQKCCDCCGCYHCFCFNSYCCKIDGDNDKKLKIINEKIREIEDIGSIKDENGEKKYIRCFLFLLYSFSFFHFFALSEIDLIASALLKEIVKSLKWYPSKHYYFSDGVIRTFTYFLTDSNYHDSSQINFNYIFSFLSLYVINLIKNKYRTAIIYIIAIVGIFILFLTLLSHDYLEEEDMIPDKEGKTKCYSGFEFTFYFLIPYIIIYLLAGFISLLPHKLLDEFIKNKKVTSIWYIMLHHILMNSIMGVSVIVKNIFNFYYLYEYKQYKTNTSLLFWQTLAFFIPSIIFLFFLFLKDCYCKSCCCCANKNDQINNEDNKNKKNKDDINYLAGYILVKTETISSFITVKGLNKYILSLITNAKIIFILLINFLSRMQKLKFKTDYKNEIKKEFWLFLNFLFTFILYGVVLSIILIFLGYFFNKKNNEFSVNNLIEKSIMIYIIIVFIFSLAGSIAFLASNYCNSGIVYCLIFITGSLNFIFYDYYSLQEVEYISLSGIISLAQLIFRSVDTFCSPFDKNSFYILQIGASVLGLLFSFFYFSKFLKRDLNLCFCI